jgi:hypothetical protein
LKKTKFEKKKRIKKKKFEKQTKLKTKNGRSETSHIDLTWGFSRGIKNYISIYDPRYRGGLICKRNFFISLMFWTRPGSRSHIWYKVSGSLGAFQGVQKIIFQFTIPDAEGA